MISCYLQNKTPQKQKIRKNTQSSTGILHLTCQQTIKLKIIYDDVALENRIITKIMLCGYIISYKDGYSPTKKPLRIIKFKDSTGISTLQVFQNFQYWKQIPQLSNPKNIQYVTICAQAKTQGVFRFEIKLTVISMNNHALYRCCKRLYQEQKLNENYGQIDNCKRLIKKTNIKNINITNKQTYKKMRKRKSTITQQYSPTFRKKINTNYLSLSLPGAYTNIQNPQCQSSNQYHTEQQQQIQQKSHTPSNIFSSQKAFNPKYMQRVQIHYNQFILNSKKIHEIIQNVDQVMRIRMQAHEQSLLTVIKSEIQKMQEQCKNIIQQYNTMIQNKNKDEEIYYLKNQLDYFRNQALFHFLNGKKVMEENKDLKELLKNKDSIIEDLNQVIKKKTVKLLKQRSFTGRMMEEKMGKFSEINRKYNEKQKQKQKQIQEQTQRQKIQIKQNQSQDFLLTKIKKITLKKLAIEDTTLPRNQLKYYAQSTKKYKTYGNNSWNSAQKSSKPQNTKKQLKNKFFWDKNSQKKIIKANISSQKSQNSQKEQEKNQEKINGIKIISKLSLKKLDKSKSFWNFQNKFSI